MAANLTQLFGLFTSRFFHKCLLPIENKGTLLSHDQKYLALYSLLLKIPKESCAEEEVICEIKIRGKFLDYFASFDLPVQVEFLRRSILQNNQILMMLVNINEQVFIGSLLEILISKGEQECVSEYLCLLYSESKAAGEMYGIFSVYQSLSRNSFPTKKFYFVKEKQGFHCVIEDENNPITLKPGSKVLETWHRGNVVETRRQPKRSLDLIFSETKKRLSSKRIKEMIQQGAKDGVTIIPKQAK